MGWWEDLQNLLGSTVGQENNPIDELQRGDYGGAATAPLTAAMNVMGLPLSAVKEAVGQTQNVVGGHGLGPIGTGRAAWEQDIKNLNQSDMGALGFAKSPIEIALELGLDPTTYLGIGLGARAAEAARTIAAAPEVGGLASTTLRGLAGGVDAADLLFNRGPNKVMEPVLHTAGGLARKAITKVAPSALEFEPKSALRRYLSDVQQARGTQLANRSQFIPGETVPALLHGTTPAGISPGKSLAPIDQYNVPPFFDSKFDTGISSAVKQKAYESYQRLAAKHQSFPDIPGVNAPGMGEAPWWMNAQDFGQSVPYGKPGSKTFLDKLRDQPLGIVNLPGRQNQTMFQTPFQLGQLDEQDLRDMANIAAAVMVDFDNQHANKMFAPLLRASLGNQAIVKELSRQFGPGIEPAIPAMYNDYRAILQEKGISVGEAGSRFLTHWGFPEGTVPTRSLKEIQKKVDAGTLSHDDAFKQIAGIAFNKRKPGLVEHAAGMGAGFMASTDQGITVHPHQGPFAIPGIDAETGRATVNEEFRSQFQKNKEAYDQYVTQLFGQIQPQELETLRKMSIEALYDEYVNAAGEYSGGIEGATKLFQEGPSFTPTGKSRDEFTKIGVYPGEGSIAGNQRVMPEGLPGGTHNKPTLKALNQALMDEHQLIHPKKNPTNAEISKFLTENGITPWQANPRGGPLMYTQGLIDHYMAGKDIPVGDTVASDWYDNAVKEVMRIVGPGNYEDAMVLMELMAATSSSTGVKTNAENALKAFAEWKMGSDEAIRTGLNLSNEEVDAILNKGGRWTGIPRTDLTAKLTGDELFMGAMAKDQKRTAGKIFQNYINQRSATDPSWLLSQAGPKTNNYAGSFVIKLWQDATDMIPNVGLRDKVRKALDEAATIYTVDRHDIRQSNLATSVTPMGAIVHREARLIGAKEVPHVRPEDVQAATWYWAKDQQGFYRVGRDDDMANALRDAWNKKLDPGADARIREKLRAENPNITEGELQTQADDLMRQEVTYAYIKDALGSNKGLLQRVLGEGHPVAALMDAGDHTLGLVHRASQGVQSRVPLSRSIPILTSQAEDLLKQVSSGEIQGATLKYAENGRSFVPTTEQQGFAVALTSSGRDVSTARTKTSARAIERFLGKYSDILDDPAVAQHIRFDIRPTGEGKASFDLSIIVPDEAVATEIGRAFNQQSVYDLGAGRTIHLGGTGQSKNIQPQDIRDTIRGVFGETATSRPTLSDVRARGVGINEMDSVNPISIMQRKVVRPLMQRYRQLSESGAEALSANGITPAKPAGVPDSTTPFDFGSIGHDPLLSTQENVILNQPMNGTTVGQQLDQWHQEATNDIKALDDAKVMWDPNTPYKERLKMLESRPDLQKVVKKYHDLGLDIRYANPHAVEMRQLERSEAKSRGIDLTKSTTWDLLRAAWGEQALFSPKYHTGNLQGSWIQNALGGHFDHQGPGQVLAAFKIVRSGADIVSKKEAMNSLHAGQIAQKWGFEELPSYIFRGGVRDMVSTSTRGHGTATGQLIGKLTHNERLASLVSKPLEANADAGSAVDIVGRGAVWSDVLDREMTNAMHVIEGDIMDMADKQGLKNFEFSQSDLINPVPGGPSAKKLKAHLMQMGFQEGYAERAGRNFAEARNIAERMAKDEMEKRQFSYDRTNLDEWVSKVIPFHYWYSRAIRYYGEEALRHPFLLLNYMRANDGIEDAQTDPGLSARQKGFLRLMQTPLGFTLLMNPDSFFGVVKAFGFDDPGFEPAGQTTVGGAINWLKQRGLGLYPWLDGTMNLMGVYGDTFEPDLLGIRHKALIGATINFARSQLGMEPASAPYQQAMGQLRYDISNFVSQFTPDWLTKPVLPKAGGDQQDATIDTVIESRIVANNPGITNQDLLDIMSDPDSPQYREAYQQEAAAGVIQQLMNFALPQNYRMREASKDVRSAEISTITEAANRQGVSPTEFRPTISDVDFAARYKQLTGKDWAPGDYATAKQQSDLTRATPEQKPFVVQQNEYYSLGTEEQRRIYQKYQDIRNGNVPETATKDQVTRGMLADTWANKMGYTGIINDLQQQRQAYEMTHPDFAEYKDWQGQMFDLSNRLGGSLAEYRRQSSQQNPNAARYFNDMIQYVHQNFPQNQWEAEIERRTTSAEAYQSITGKKQARFDPSPTPGFPPVDVTLPNMATAGPAYNGPSYDWLQALNNIPGRMARF